MHHDQVVDVPKQTVLQSSKACNIGVGHTRNITCNRGIMIWSLVLCLILVDIVGVITIVLWLMVNPIWQSHPNYQHSDVSEHVLLKYRESIGRL